MPKVEVFETVFPDRETLSKLRDFYLVFSEGELVVSSQKFQALELEHLEVLGRTSEPRFVAHTTSDVFYLVTTDGDIADQFESVSLRDPRFADDPFFFNLVSRASQLRHFHSRHGHCALCSGVMGVDEVEGNLSCQSCGTPVYPTVSPCIIVLIERGDECLLVRRHAAKHNRYSLVSGFVEAGESAEHALVREVREEVNLEVESLHYFGSQSWPFPGQLMLGYSAVWKSGELVLQESELRDGNWFHYKDLPPHPGPETIAGQIIDNFVQRRKRLAGDA